MKHNCASYRRIKLPHLDTLELLRAEDYQQDFPPHAHDTFCISLIEQGTFNENEHFAPPGSICLTNPNEIHVNQLVHPTGYSFITLYPSPDLLVHQNAGQPVLFTDKVIFTPLLYQQLKKIVLAIVNDPFASQEAALAQWLHELIACHSKPHQAGELDYNHNLQQVKLHIADRLEQKISLEAIARMVGMDKYKFIRYFKKHTGLSPFAYIILQRIEKAKLLLKQGQPLVYAALESGFYDQSHFSTYFKYYVGVTPAVYQMGCNILQE
jgi:AraC-like DNA-binding protein